MIHPKRIFHLLFLCCISQAPVFACLATRTGLLFKTYSMGNVRRYHTDTSTQNWQQWRNKIFGPRELPTLEAKGIEGFTVDQVDYLTKSKPEKLLSETCARSKTKLTQLAEQAIKQSEKNSTERAEKIIRNALSKKED
ncbi:MAG TPA: hypothetical protein VL201_05540 [Patescibacteria group bacterium]|jgi:hypothetical protein|nr:hypothetical protein [Patescibacteria group bacterium]